MLFIILCKNVLFKLDADRLKNMNIKIYYGNLKIRILCLCAQIRCVASTAPVKESHKEAPHRPPVHFSDSRFWANSDLQTPYYGSGNRFTSSSSFRGYNFINSVSRDKRPGKICLFDTIHMSMDLRPGFILVR